MTEVKKEAMDEDMQDDAAAPDLQLSAEKEFQLMTMEILSEIKVVIDSTASDVKYLVERIESGEQEMNQVKECVLNNASMLMTNSQTLQNVSNSIGGLNNFGTSQLGLGGILGGANSGDMLQQAKLSQQIAALQSQQQQLQNKSLGRGGLLNGLNGASKYLNGLNNQKRPYQRKNNQNQRYGANLGQLQQNSYNLNIQNNGPSLIEKNLQQQLGTDPREQELLMEQQRAKAKVQPMKMIRPMARPNPIPSKDKEENSKEIVLTDSEDESKDPSKKKSKSSDNDKDKDEETKSMYSDEDNDDESKLKKRNTSDIASKDEKEEDGAKADGNDNVSSSRKSNKDDNGDDDERQDRQNNLLKSSIGASISSKYNLSKFGIGDDQNSDRLGSMGLSALRDKFNLPRFGNDNDQSGLSKFGSSGLGSSLRSKLNLPSPMDDRAGPLGISADLRNKYNLSNLVNNIQSSWQNKFQIGSNSSTNLLDSMRPGSKIDSIGNRLLNSSGRTNERDVKDTKEKDRGRRANSEDRASDGSDDEENDENDEEGNEKEKFTFESEEEKDDEGDDLPMM